MRASRTPGCSDLDLGASVVHVERQWNQYEGPIEPKSRSSRRTVPVLGILRDHLDEHQLRAGKCGVHECRHTFASLLIDAGANLKAIQTFVGHSKIQTTVDKPQTKRPALRGASRGTGRRDMCVFCLCEGGRL